MDETDMRISGLLLAVDYLLLRNSSMNLADQELTHTWNF